jgi:hypothetical protein
VAGDAEPAAVFADPSIGEAAQVVIWLAAVRSLGVIRARHDRGVLEEGNLNILNVHKGGLELRVANVRQKFLAIADLAVEFGIGKRLRHHGSERTGIGIDLSLIPHMLQDDEFRYAGIGLSSLRPGGYTKQKRADDVPVQAAPHTLTRNIARALPGGKGKASPKVTKVIVKNSFMLYREHFPWNSGPTFTPVGALQQPSEQPFQSNFTGEAMKYLPVVLLTLVLSAACGAGHPNLKSITVTPATATATTQGSVGFTATGIFSDNSSRTLTPADGLSWRSSNTAVASINDAGMASCNAPGGVTITASAPENLQLTINTGISNTAPTIRGAGTLNCT